MVDQRATEWLTVRDDVPVGNTTNRFYQLRVWLP
jgi:hypothetical protein